MRAVSYQDRYFKNRKIEDTNRAWADYNKAVQLDPNDPKIQEYRNYFGQ
jgi:hypothetical protein